MISIINVNNNNINEIIKNLKERSNTINIRKSVEEIIENILLVLTKKKMGAVCISDTGHENGKLIGIITEGDIRRALHHKEKFFTYRAKDIMIENPISVQVESMALDALHLMENRESQINVLPVVKDNNIVGIIRIHDLVGLR